MSKTTGWPRRAAALVAAAMLLTPLATGSARAQPPAPPSAQPPATPPAASGTTDRARQHYARGKELFAAAEYRQAIGEFAAADKLAPSPLLEFNIALCHERLLERGEAIRRYRLYLSRVPDAKNRADVEQRIARLEEAMKAEADARSAPPAAGAVVPGAPVPGAPPTSPGATPTGDPDLDRVARIDIGRLRAERRAGAPARPAPPRTAAAPAPSPSPAPASAPDRGEPKKERPIYKRWWFWVVAGVSAIVIINIATADSDSSDSRALLLPMGDGRRDAPGQGGAVLLRF
jgi:tetratricopeptide (TPR) repeat protein